MTAQESRINKTVNYSLREWQEVEAWLKAHGEEEFSPFAKKAIAEKMERGSMRCAACGYEEE